MNPSDRARLTSELRDHVASIAADLRAKIREPGPARARAEKLHADERVGEEFEVWTDLLSRRAAVLWVLKSVYVRVLEDRGLLSPGRLLDPEAQQLFEKLAPHLGETAFLSWIYRDLASPNGGMPELFSPQPAEVALPSDEHSRALISFWRHKDADSGATWSFADEHFDGELMGDLYQELDPVVKDRFALCQTPDFVRAFILDRTLTSAIETFGTEEVRLLDPACGSGHFLIDGMKRLVAATAEKHAGWDKAKVVAHVLNRVVGIDLNDYACALARTRLIMTAAELAGVTKLADAARFHPHIYWADGLEQVERDEQKPALQFSLFEKVEDAPRATLTRSDVRAALRKVFEKKFHAVVANPPYITEKDAARKEYQREKTGKKQRYVSAYREYSLGSPFTERCFQLAEKDGFVGIITSNNFMKREFGKPLVETVLAGLDLTLVVDTSQAYIPFHGTPTVLIFARNRRPDTDTVRAVMGKRGENGTPEDPAKGKVWLSVADGWATVGFENDFVSVAALPRTTLSKHPWSLGGGGAAELKERLQRQADRRLAQCVESIGFMCITKQDDVYVQSAETLRRFRVEEEWIRPFGMGDVVRDWYVSEGPSAVFPYDPNIELRQLSNARGASSYLWRFRRVLEERAVFGGETFRTAKRPWWEYGQIPKDRFRTQLSIAFAFVATHNHFVLDRGGKLFNRSAPVIKLPAGASEDEHLALVGLLNSSIACFWMKQVFHNKGGGTDAGKMQSDPAKVAYEFTATGLESFPVPVFDPAARDRLIELARAIDKVAAQRGPILRDALPDANALPDLSSQEMRRRLVEAEAEEARLLATQIALQEEIDWLIYRVYGLITQAEYQAVAISEPGDVAVPIGSRPFEIAQAQSGRVVGVDGQSLSSEVPVGLPKHIASAWASRVQIIQSNSTVSLVEVEHYKRRWLLTPKHLAGRVETFADRLGARLQEVLADLVERSAREIARPFDIARLAARLQSDSRFALLAEVITGKPDFSAENVILTVLANHSVASHRTHRYSPAGQVKHAAWEATWDAQRREDAGERCEPPVPPTYVQGDFVSRRVFELRGKLDVPTERFIAFTEVPGRVGGETLYGWAGWTAQQRVKAILAIDEELEDASVPLADRIGLLDSAWRLLPDVAREDAPAANRLKAELQALVGPEGPSAALIEDWKTRFPLPNSRTARRPSEEAETEESLDDLPSVIPNVSDEEHAAILIWALLHASGGTVTRMDLARAFALRARPALLKKHAPTSLKREVAHWASTVGSRSVKAGLLASTLNALAARNGVALGTDSESRSTVSASPRTPSEAQIDPWFLFEANLALKVLRAQPEEKFSAIDKALTGADRKLLEHAA
jgi:hypothetical protein